MDPTSDNISHKSKTFELCIKKYKHVYTNEFIIGRSLLDINDKSKQTNELRILNLLECMNNSMPPQLTPSN